MQKFNVNLIKQFFFSCFFFCAFEYSSKAQSCDNINPNALVNTFPQVFTCGADDVSDFVIGMSDATSLSYNANTQVPNKFSNSAWTLENIGNILFTEFDGAGCLYAPATAFTMFSTRGALQQFGALGGADAIYKMDAITGAPQVWTSIPTSGNGYGAITYDYITNTMYVVNLGNNSIYQLDMGGNILDVFQPDPTILGVVNGTIANGFPVTNFQNHPFGLDINPIDGRLYYTVVDATGGGSMVVRSVERDGCGSFVPPTDREEINFVMENTFNVDEESESDPVVGDIDFSTSGEMAVGSWSSGPVENSYYAEGLTNSMFNHTAGVYTFSQSGGLWSQTTVSSVGVAMYSPATVNATATGGVAWDVENTDVLWMSGGDFVGENSNWGIIGYDINQLDNVYDQEDATNYIQFLFEPQNFSDPKGNGGEVDVFRCVPCTPPQPPVVSVTDSDCQSTPGSFTIDTPCGAGSHIEWSVDGGITFTDDPLNYDETTSLTLKIICIDDVEGCQSSIFEISTMPAGAVQNCIRQFGEFVILKNSLQ